MKSTLDQVKEFHEVFGHPTKDKVDLSDKKTNDLRVSLLQEELDELKEALDNNDPVEVLDALTDLQYVLDGAYLSLGLHKVKDFAFYEVHRSNMSKLGNDGKPIIRPEDGKVMKGENYFEPDLSPFVQEGMENITKEDLEDVVVYDKSKKTEKEFVDVTDKILDKVKIDINGWVHYYPVGYELTYEEILENQGYNKDRTISVVYYYSDGRSGTLTKGQHVVVGTGLRISAADTSYA